MKKPVENKHPNVRQESSGKKIILPGYPTYPADEDIYYQGIEETEIDPEQITEKKAIEKNDDLDETDLYEIFSGEYLDIPDDEPEIAPEDSGDEDEENNYYSLGGDAHQDLEENMGI